jgi:hypothetical protein
MWREALAEALSAYAGYSIFGHGFASAGRDTLALVGRIFQHVEPCPLTNKPRALLRFFDGSKVKSAVCFYQTMLVTIKELNGHSHETERSAVLKLTIEQAQAELDKLLLSHESSDSSGSSVKVVLIVAEIDKLINTSWGKPVIQQLLQWAHAATSRFVWIGLTALLFSKQSMAQKCLVPKRLPREVADYCESIIDATIGPVMAPGAVKCFVKPAAGSDVSIALAWCCRAVDFAISMDNSADHVSLEQLGLACRDAYEVEYPMKFGSGVSPWLLHYFKQPAVWEILGRNVAKSPCYLEPEE